MKRPLYIDGSRQSIAVSLDGPALCLHQPERADARAPLRLLSRIVVCGSVEWTTAALLACCDAGVPVAFVRGDGSPRGWCLGDNHSEPEINALLEEAALQADFAGRHEDWMRGLERRAALAALAALGLISADLRPSAVWAACEARVDRLGPPVEAAQIMATLAGALAVHVLSLLRREGVGIRFVAGHETPVRLASDFCRLLRWRLWPEGERTAAYLARHARKHRGENAVRRRIVRRYEGAAPAIERAFADLFRRLRWHLKDGLP